MRAIVLLGLLAGATPAWAAPGPAYVPRSDSEVLLRLPPLTDARVRRAEALRRALRARPGDVNAAVGLAHTYIDYARTSGDARFLGRALAVVDPWLSIPSPPTSVLMVQATVLQSRHLFAPSRAVLERVLKADPDDGQAWLTLASVAQVQGDMTGARHACAHLMGGMDALVTAACLGSLDTVTGRARDGYEAMAMLLRQQPGEAPAIRAWVEGLLADAARSQGRDALAETHFKAALQASPADNFLLADFADFLLDHARAAEVVALIGEQTQSESLLLRRVLAEQALATPQAAGDAAQLAQQFHDLELRGDAALFAREHARFALEVLHQPAQALRLALQDWQIQREPLDARVLLAAARAAGEPRRAQGALDFVDANHLEDPGVRAEARRLRQALQAGAR